MDPRPHRPGRQGLHARPALRPALHRRGHDVHLVHGSPRKVNEHLFEDKPARLYERLAAAEDADALVFGHTHNPWVHDYGDVRLLNCGSVDKPKDGDPAAPSPSSARSPARSPPRSNESTTTPSASPAEYAEKLLAGPEVAHG